MYTVQFAVYTVHVYAKIQELFQLILNERFAIPNPEEVRRLAKASIETCGLGSRVKLFASNFLENYLWTRP